MNRRRLLRVGLFQILSLGLALPLAAQGYYTNGIEHFAGGATVANVTTNPGTSSASTLYYGTTTGDFNAYKCDGTAYKLNDPDPVLSGVVNPQVGYNGYIKVSQSASLAHLFDGPNTASVQVPVYVAPVSGGTKGCKTTTNGVKAAATTNPGGVWAPYLFYDTYTSTNPATYLLYMYYSDHTNNDTMHISAVNAAPASVMNNAAWADQGVSWFPIYDIAVYHSNKTASGTIAPVTSNTSVPAQVWDGVDNTHYYAFFAGGSPNQTPNAGNGGTQVLKLDTPITLDAQSIKSKSSATNVAPVLIAFAASKTETDPQGDNYQPWEHWCNAESGANEAPQPFNSPDGSTLFVDYSANSYQSDFYAMGLLQFTPQASSGDLTIAANWTKLADPSGQNLPWFGPEAVANAGGYQDATCTNTNPNKIQQTAGPNPSASAGPTVSGGNYVVSSGSNSMVWDTNHNLWNIYGATYHSTWTNNRELRMEPVLFNAPAIGSTAQTPTWDQHPVPEGTPVTVANDGTYTNAPIFTTPSISYNWYDLPAQNANNLAYDPSAGPNSSSGYNGDSGEDQPGVYFSTPQTNTAANPLATPTNTGTGSCANYLDPVNNTCVTSLNSEVIWTPSADGTSVSNYSPYSYFIIQYVGTGITAYGPTDGGSTGKASVFDDGVIDNNATPVNLAKLTNNVLYSISGLTYGFHTLMMSVQAQGNNAAVRDSNATGNLPIQASDQSTAVKLGLSTFVINPAPTYLQPTISGVSPTSGSTAGGTSVAITGTNLTGIASVSFGANSAASFSVSGNTQATAVSPAGSGTVDITVTNPSYTSATSAADQFTYKTSPTISWTPSAQATYIGMPIGSGVLDATSNTAGTFAYTATNAANTTVSITAASTLPAGAYTLTATLTPTDTTDYTTQTATAVFTVVSQEVFVISSGGSASSFYESGSQQSTPTSGAGIGAAVDASGNVWSINSSGSSVSVFSDQGALRATYSGAGMSGSTALAIDGANIAWIANGDGTVSAMTNGGVAVSTTTIDPGGASAAPASVSVDASGSLWLSGKSTNSLIEVVGLATPVVAPTVKQVVQSDPGTEP